MRMFAGLLKAEWKKLAHTPVFWIHVILPVLGAAVFLTYDFFAGWNARSEVQMYLEVLSGVFPFLAGIICGQAAEMELQSGYQNFLCLPCPRPVGLLAKWTVLMAGALFSSLVAVLGFGLVYCLFPEGDVCSLSSYLAVALVMWAGQGIVYLLHLFLGFQFGNAASVSVGVVGTIAAFLMMTGLGQGRWMFFPHAWSEKWCDFMLALIFAGNTGAISILKSGAWQHLLLICTIIFVGLGTAVLLWVTFFEGRKKE